jgi:hypothetical protein
MNIYAFPLKINNTERNALSVLNPDFEFRDKIISKAVVGYLINPIYPIVHQNIVYNPDFIDYFHKTVKISALLTLGINQSYKNQKGGYVYILDDRADKNKKAEPQDVVGSFEIKDGEILEESYTPNAQYEFISEKGVCKLTPEFETIFFKAIKL